MHKRLFRARTLYIGSALWLLALWAYFSIAPNPPIDSRTFVVTLVLLEIGIWVPIVFAIWQGVHWLMSRSARKTDKAIGVEEDTSHASMGTLPAGLARLSVADIQKLADYRTLKAALGRASTFSFVFGGLGIVTAMQPSTQAGALVSLALAAVLVQQGLWLRRSHNPIGLITGGLTMIALGLWTMSSGLGEDASSSSFLPTLGIWQIVWGAGVLRRFSDMRLRRLGKFEPDEEALRTLDDLASELSLGRAKSAGGVVFTASDWVHSMRLIGRFMPHLAVFVSERGDDLFVGDPSDTSITPAEKSDLEKEFKALLKIGDHSFRGTCGPHSYERYQHWKSRAGV